MTTRRRPERTAWALLLAAVLTAVTAVALPQSASAASDPPLTGWDTYRHLDQLPYLNSGEHAADEAAQFSSFDRDGGNLDGGTGDCLPGSGEECLLAEDHGPGEITSIWFTSSTNGVKGDVSGIGGLRIELDGEVVVDAPLIDVVNGELGAPFEFPLVANSDQSSGGVYIKVPMPYHDSMRVVVDNHPGYYHVDHRRFSSGAGVSTFDPAEEAQDVIDMFDAAGDQDPKPAKAGAITTSATIDVPNDRPIPAVRLDKGGVITQLRVRLPDEALTDDALANLRLQIAFDGERTVDSPIGEFFGTGLGDDPSSSLMFRSGDGSFTTWWPMPFTGTVTVAVDNNTDDTVSDVEVETVSAPDAELIAALRDGTAGYFSTVSNRGDTVPGEDWNFADVEGHGKLVGVTQAIRGSNPDLSLFGRDYLEGDERFYVDGSATPQLYGSGTEDFYEGGWYFINGEYNAPLTGNPAYEVAEDGCDFHCDSMFRLLLADAVPYEESLRAGMEHGLVNDRDGLYSSTAYLYTQPDPAAVRTDALEVDDEDSLAEHEYSDGDADQYSMTSVYEGDDDTSEITDDVRATTEPVTFTVAVDPTNVGVRLRRASDQSEARQEVQVTIEGVDVGTWLQPRGNSGQRWLEDSFPVPAELTANQSVILVTLTPENGAPPWTAAQYFVDSMIS